MKRVDSSMDMDDKWKCFGCFHIRTAIITVGLWHLAIHLLGFLLYFGAYYLVPNSCSNTLYEITHHSTLISADNIKIWSYMSLASFSATLLLIVGVLKKKSNFILPFLLIQVFDILFDILVITIQIMLAYNTKEFFSQLQKPPLQRFLARTDSVQNELFTMVYIAISFSIKTYLMRISYLYYDCVAHSKNK